MIGGARAAELSGRIAALGIAHDLGFVRSAERDRRTGVWREERDLELSLRPLIDRAFPPYRPALAPKDQTTVCRCEEISAGTIRDAARSGAAGVNHVKVLTRAGMGRCQGRLCGTTIARLVAQENGQPIEDVGVLTARPPVKPVTLGVLADLVEPESAGTADD
ncbi:MAG: (2Fe-2S)-binding protein [Shimia sp.]|uniref:(2Fe-2S)-binding protein n=1 Tax=Shimia sp. TaxID=1954381 RepID=UPI004058E5E7